jgi:hypothetical protein
LLCGAISALELLTPELHACLRFIHRREATLQHFVRHVASTEGQREVPETPYVDCRKDPLVLILSVDVGSDTAIEEERSQPGVSFFGKGLCGTAEMGELGCIDARQADMDLIRDKNAPSDHKERTQNAQELAEKVEHTVRSFNSFFDVGIFFHGSHPHPASLPPGV